MQYFSAAKVSKFSPDDKFDKLINISNGECNIYTTFIRFYLDKNLSITDVESSTASMEFK